MFHLIHLFISHLFRQSPDPLWQDLPIKLIAALKPEKDNAHSIELYKQLMALEQEMFRLMLEDRRLAREAYPSVARRFGFLALLVAGLIACFYVMYSVRLSKEQLAVVSALSGILGMCLKDIYAFEFGSSEIPKRTWSF